MMQKNSDVKTLKLLNRIMEFWSWLGAVRHTHLLADVSRGQNRISHRAAHEAAGHRVAAPRLDRG